METYSLFFVGIDTAAAACLALTHHEVHFCPHSRFWRHDGSAEYRASYNKFLRQKPSENPAASAIARLYRLGNTSQAHQRVNQLSQSVERVLRQLCTTPFRRWHLSISRATSFKKLTRTPAMTCFLASYPILMAERQHPKKVTQRPLKKVCESRCGIYDSTVKMACVARCRMCISIRQRCYWRDAIDAAKRLSCRFVREAR